MNQQQWVYNVLQMLFFFFLYFYILRSYVGVLYCQQLQPPIVPPKIANARAPEYLT